MKRFIVIPFAFILSISLSAQALQEESLKQRINQSLTNIYSETMLRPGKVTVDSIALNERKKNVQFYTNLSLSYLPMRESTVMHIYDSIRYHLPPAQKKYLISVFSDGQEISYLIPNYFRSTQKDKSRMIAHRIKKPDRKSVV